MSFSTETKNELARVISGNECCNIAELSALVKSGGSIQIVGYKKLNHSLSSSIPNFFNNISEPISLVTINT